MTQARPMNTSCFQQKEDEIKHKDFCVAEFNTNELQTEKKERSKQDLSAKIQDLEQTIKSLTEAIDKLKSEIAEMQVQMKRAGEDREKENKDDVTFTESLECFLIQIMRSTSIHSLFAFICACYPSVHLRLFMGVCLH